jgi:hypothetical protein
VTVVEVRTLTIYHGGIVRELPAVAQLDFSTDRELAERRAAQWGEHGHVLELEIEVGPRNRPVDRRFRYLPNMPMMKPGQKQFVYDVGKTEDQIKAKRAAVAAAGQRWEIG